LLSIANPYSTERNTPVAVPDVALPSLPWIEVASCAPYFVTDNGENWTPIGQNDAITWPDLAGAFRRKDLKSVENYLAYLVAHGVTCLRLMLEYCHTENRYFERPAGVFQPNMIRLWDDLFALCAQYGLRIMLTPYDTFWMRRRWSKHPYNRANGGPCRSKSHWVLCPETLSLIKARLAFATRRWGGSGVLFAWDLWNEIDPVHAGNSCLSFPFFVTELSGYLRQVELETHGRAHLQTVSVYGPLLKKHPELTEVVFRHPLLDFASVHFYDAPLRRPTDTLKPALRTGQLTRQALLEIPDNRPFLDSEHGPDRSFRNKSGHLSPEFDEEYFRHMQWAHLASGGAGGGFRWPYRHPHRLTEGMRRAQCSLAGFTQLVNWRTFPRRNLTEQLKVKPGIVKGMACGDAKTAIVWLVRADGLNAQGMVGLDAAEAEAVIQLPGMEAGTYSVCFWNTRFGEPEAMVSVLLPVPGALEFRTPPFRADLAMLVSKCPIPSPLT
jgi:hypothetical protein